MDLQPACCHRHLLVLQYLLGHGARTPLVTWWWWAQMSNRQNSRILRYVLAGHWFSESAKNCGWDLSKLCWCPFHEQGVLTAAQIMVFASKTGTFLSGKVVVLCISRSHGMDFGLPDGSRFWHRHPPYENSSRQVVRGCQTKLGTSFFRGASFFWCSFLGSGYEAARTAGAFSTLFLIAEAMLRWHYHYNPW